MCLQRWLYRTRRWHMYRLYDRELQRCYWKCTVHAMWAGKILWCSGCHCSVDMFQLSGFFWQFVYYMYYIFGLCLQRRLHRSQCGPVHRMCRGKIQRCTGNGAMQRLSHSFKFARQQHGTCCLRLQRWLHRSQRWHMYGMRHRKIQNCSWNGDMHVLRGRIVFSRSWCYGVCQLSVELRCFVRRMFDAQQLRVQRGLYGVKRQLYSV